MWPRSSALASTARATRASLTATSASRAIMVACVTSLMRPSIKLVQPSRQATAQTVSSTSWKRKRSSITRMLRIVTMTTLSLPIVVTVLIKTVLVSMLHIKTTTLMVSQRLVVITMMTSWSALILQVNSRARKHVSSMMMTMMKTTSGLALIQKRLKDLLNQASIAVMHMSRRKHTRCNIRAVEVSSVPSSMVLFGCKYTSISHRFVSNMICSYVVFNG